LSTEKRDNLATATALVLPAALQDIEFALGYIEAGKIAEGVDDIQDALARLKALIPLFDEACIEARR
jgi:hypothetical protein